MAIPPLQATAAGKQEAVLLVVSITKSMTLTKRITLLATKETIIFLLILKTALARTLGFWTRISLLQNQVTLKFWPRLESAMDTQIAALKTVVQRLSFARITASALLITSSELNQLYQPGAITSALHSELNFKALKHLFRAT